MPAYAYRTFSGLKVFLIEVLGFAIFLLAAYRMLAIVFFDDMSKLIMYVVILLIGFLLMSYQNLFVNFERLTSHITGKKSSPDNNKNI